MADVYRNINRDQLTGWLEAEDGNGFVHALGVGNTEIDLIRQDIRALISGAMNAPLNSFRVSAPSRANADDPPPTTFFLSGLPQEVADNLIRNRVLASNQLHGDQRFAIRFTPLLPNPPSFLGVVAGLSFDEDEAEIATQPVWRNFQADQAVWDFLVNNLAGGDDEDVVIAAINNISLTPLRIGTPNSSRTRVVFRVYWATPFTDTATHVNFGEVINNMIIQDLQGGDGTFSVQPYRCGYCDGIDHPTGLCPYLSMTSFQGPTQEDFNSHKPARPRQQNPTTNGRGGKGGRGGG
ncbi:hypothetical protein PM082_014423 [Marasmius tenuissimus]|nr:hypothetical protein PM082_014423 [Marasmius tenuissimus]